MEFLIISSALFAKKIHDLWNSSKISPFKFFISSQELKVA